MFKFCFSFDYSFASVMIERSKSSSTPSKPLPLTWVMVFSASKKLRYITIDVVYIIMYNSSHKKKRNVFV